jgi:hypothetical protein
MKPCTYSGLQRARLILQRIYSAFTALMPYITQTFVRGLRIKATDAANADGVSG